MGVGVANYFKALAAEGGSPDMVVMEVMDMENFKRWMKKYDVSYVDLTMWTVIAVLIIVETIAQLWMHYGG